METNENYKKVGFILLGICVGALMVYQLVTTKPFTCDSYAKEFKMSFACNLILNHIEANTGTAEIYGTDLITKRDTMVKEYTKWVITNISEFASGDTIEKQLGSYTIYIKRKGKSFNIPFHCDRIYPDTAGLH